MSISFASIVPSPLALAAAAEHAATAAAESIRYAVSATWEEYINGKLTETRVDRQVLLQHVPQGESRQVRLTQQVVLPAPYTPHPLQRLALQLSALYSDLELVMSSTGEPTALTNYAHIARKWRMLEGELRQACHADDTLVQTLLEQVEKQLQDPERMLQSLHHDYVYRALLHPLGKAAAPGDGYPARLVEFSQFFDGQSIWFSEYMSVKAAQVSTQLARTFRGVLDEQRTDLPRLQRRIQNLVHPHPAPQPRATAPSSVTLSSGGLHCGYEAVHTVATATGLADKVVLTVYCRFAEIYNKQYSLTIQRL